MDKNQLSNKKKEYFHSIIIAFVIMITAGISLFVFSVGSFRGPIVLAQLSYTTIGMIFAAVLLIYCCLIIRERTRKGQLIFFASLLLYIDIIISGTVDYFTGTAHSGGLIFVMENALSVILIVIQLLLWLYESESFQDNRYKKQFTIWFCALSFAYIVALIINIFTGFMFCYDDYGRVTYGGGIVDSVFFFLAYSSYLVYVLPQKCSMRKKLSFAAIAFIPLFSIVLMIVNSFYNVYYEGSSSLVIALILATYTIFFGDYMEERHLLLSQKAELAEQYRTQTELKTELMLSQIKPHFLYNAISAIRNTCKTDPAKAYTALGLFADYLRTNMDTLEKGKMISFDQELEHIETYLFLEQMRFGDELEVEYDMQYTDFLIPALAVQPIVENAVRHGATLNENGGRIVISSRKFDDDAIITVRDNGPGFDPDAPLTDGRNHFGITNVRNMLRIKNCGELYIDSVPGAGTTVTITIWGRR